ncbi:MAG: parB [Candidatus Saccharibacteria bacterium]|nr:parB [Candidatus Saccharibacteria bacterium]
MSAKARKGGLGRGFDSLIPTDLFDETFDPTAQQDEKVSELRNVNLDDVIADPDQPRRHFEEVPLQELAASIKEHGILQPIVVTSKNGKYHIVAGERRYRAAKLAGLTKIPVLIRTLSAQNKLELSLIENIQRRDLNPLETATAYLKLRDQFNMTLDQIGARVGGKSVSAVSNTLRLLRLPTVVKTAMIEGKLTEGQARPLIGVDEKIVAKVIDQIIREDWSARKVEQFIISLRTSTPKDATKMASSNYDAHVSTLQKRFATKIQIRSNPKGAGRIVIAFKDANEFERIQHLLEK